MHYKRASFVDPDGTPVAFSLDLVAKDLDLAAALAAELNSPAAQFATNRAVVGSAIDAGYADADLRAVAQYMRGRSGESA